MTVTRLTVGNTDYKKEVLALANGRPVFLIASDRLGAADKEFMIYIGDRHPNAKAHKIYADIIYKEIKPVIDRIESEAKGSG